MIFSVTGIELIFLDYQVFCAQTKKALCFGNRKKICFVLKIFFLHFGHTEIHSWTKNLIIKKNQLNSSHTENHTRPTNLSP
jgi:hypothetical protein